MGFWLDGKAGDHYGADCVFSDFGEVFGEDATKAKFVDAVGAAQADDPPVIEFFGLN